MDWIGPARSSSFAVGESSGHVGWDDWEGMAIKTDVKVVESGIELLKRARREVWIICGRRVRDCLRLATVFIYTNTLCGGVQSRHQWILLPREDSELGE